jgi:hypothetical protein
MGRLPSRIVALALLMAVPAAAPLPSAARLPTTAAFEEPGEGRDEAVPDTHRPTVVAAFARESYRPGQPARLVITGKAPDVTVQIYRAGTDPAWVRASDVMTGNSVDDPIDLGAVKGRRSVRMTMGNWPSGVYFAKLTSGGRIGYAPFVLAPCVLGTQPVAVVIPTQTWQAYNFRDSNRDGRGDTWYAGWHQRTARLARPFLNRGTPPHFKSNDLPFLQWAVATGHGADYLADSDLRGVKNGARLRAAYKLVIFPSHHEYVTTHEYNVIVDYRNHGGRLIFLSANNFFWRITRRGNVMTRIKRWRDLGRPEAALIGIEYFHNDRGEHRAPWVVEKSSVSDWLLAGTGLEPGSQMGSGGIEADGTTPQSPRNITVLAEIPNLYGPGLTAKMTYYETKRGAQVFAAGAFGFAGATYDRRVSRLLANVWARMAGPPAAQKALPRTPEGLRRRHRLATGTS